MTLTAEFKSKDQNWARETTTYWFEVEGTHYGTSLVFIGDVFGIVEYSEGDNSLVDCDGCPMTPGDGAWLAVMSVCVITDEMRAA